MQTVIISLKFCCLCLRCSAVPWLALQANVLFCFALVLFCFAQPFFYLSKSNWGYFCLPEKQNKKSAKSFWGCLMLVPGYLPGDEAGEGKALGVIKTPLCSRCGHHSSSSSKCAEMLLLHRMQTSKSSQQSLPPKPGQGNCF